ncbi:hypothetical protein L226DRAFT_530046 [Lentinus tigrinus ALCF2SS1-7]|uniref:Uncharacterized protein n=1 Tax=Lentinus tigrinus ALCF2SS1-6 TaxID=1328759 RepID=A0A5C2SQJ9_9APHY|nr:hypothetical protein L227DRAFT_569855 [Lentinus tigrinus ALCF2SS1-6]RPD79854.1 hypothetical protein L226DRAFT_530046 [Lentinus tigrinus ALCF2SS1-7]
MAPMDSPLNAAHQHAANADDHLAQGLLIPAAEEHYKAAEAFQACVEASNDDNTKRTLRMLHNEHMKMGKDLQRRIAKLREENKDPALPQKPQRASTAGPSTSTLSPPQPVPSPPPQPQSRLSESQQTVEESFMLLGQRSDPGDAFHQFWKATEGMLEYLSRPVAFATAPLASETTAKSRARDGSSNSDTDTEDPFSKKISRGINLMKAAHSRMLTRYDSPTTGSDSDASGPSTFPPPPQPSHAIDLRDDWDDDVRAFEDDDMADSFCLIPSKSDPGMTLLKEENDTLKAELEKQRQQLAKMELALKARQEQDQQLRDSIMLVRKEAHRAMISSNVLQRPAPPPGQPQVDIASLNINVPVPPAVPAPVAALNAGRDRDPQLVRRVRELEEEVRNLRAENEKQKAMIVRFRERWEKLKESAKRKKEAKAAVESTNVVGQRIEEDPEAEAAAERDDARGSKSVEVAA